MSANKLLNLRMEFGVVVGDLGYWIHITRLEVTTLGAHNLNKCRFFLPRVIMWE